MSLLTTQQSARDPGMTPGCLITETKLLDMVDPATVNADWNIVKNKKEHVRDPSAKVIVQDGWSAPVIQSFEEFRLVDSGVCRASRSEAEEAILELRSEKGLAFLTTKNISGSVEVEFEVKTAQGQSAMWKLYLFQLGSTPVTCKCSAPQGGHVEADTALVVVDFPMEDGNDQTEVRNCTLAQETWGGTCGFSTAKIWRARRCRSDRECPEGLPREGASRKRRVRCLLTPLLRQRRVTRVQRRPASRGVRPPGRSAESESDWVNHPGGRPAQEGTWIANQRVRGGQEVHW